MGFLRLTDDVVSSDLTVQGTDLLRPDAPGLGIRLDPDRLARYLVPSPPRAAV
jgi:L-alanine-DL-glutamate epimerase-like enolase superfamily enzyme